MELGGERSEEELVSTGEQPLVADEELQASERNVRDVGVNGPGVLWRRAQARSSWKTYREFVLNIWCSGSSLEVRVRLSDHRCLLWGACHKPELWQAPSSVLCCACVV
jgi:hypothetical protein